MRAGLIADGEDEQREAEGLGVWRHQETKMPQEKAGEKHAGDWAKRKAGDPNVADQVTRAEDQEERQDGLGLQGLEELDEKVDFVHLSPAYRYRPEQVPTPYVGECATTPSASP